MMPGAPGGAPATQAVGAAKPEERPAGIVANQVSVTATIEDIAPKNPCVTAKGPGGKRWTSICGAGTILGNLV